jgi:succinate dehydrogenase/fumarate reductase flavoprotein subunit
MEGITWDKEVDALVVGSGAGGMAAALTAREEGLDASAVPPRSQAARCGYR